MRNLWLIMAFMLALPVAAGNIYRSVDEQGNPVFSDVQSPGSIEIEKREVPTMPSTLPQEPQRLQEGASRDDDEFEYAALWITAPADDTAIRDNQGNVSVAVAVDPGLFTGGGHELVLYLDGSEVARGETPVFHLTEVERGTHYLAVAIIDEDGYELKRSPESRFHLLQHSIQHPRPTPPGTPPRTTP